uniref:Uncharacterized protein n=1 Tax=Magallana gigas TaxID=29159 RepID=A0A8W8MQ04_MAGGI|nr:uncharacterized protein LOC105341738 [Crassostrea gigas]
MAGNCFFALPKTKEQLKEKNRKLRKELGTVGSQYRENVWSVIKNLKKRYDEIKYDLMPGYEKLKRLIKSSTSDEVLEGCRVPEHKHSVQNKGGCCCNNNASIDNIYDAVAARYGQSGGTFGLLKNCAELAGYVTIPKMIREVTEMHKAEIADQNEELKHYIQCYDHMFERAHKRLSNLRHEYEKSKQQRPHNRYPRLKEMVKAVIEDKKLMPDGFDEFYDANSL